MHNIHIQYTMCILYTYTTRIIYIYNIQNSIWLMHNIHIQYYIHTQWVQVRVTMWMNIHIQYITMCILYTYTIVKYVWQCAGMRAFVYGGPVSSRMPYICDVSEAWRSSKFVTHACTYIYMYICGTWNCVRDTCLHLHIYIYIGTASSWELQLGTASSWHMPAPIYIHT